jgi:RNA polymerase sigma-70 factor (ECF subfamily)
MTKETSMMSPAVTRDGDGRAGGGETLLSDEPTIELVLKARGGDRRAVEALLQRCLPGLRRWAHGKLPAYAREALDTGDLVQEAALHLLKRVDHFEPRHVGAMQAYLRMSVMNRIRDEIRRVGRRPASVELIDEPAADAPSPLELTIQAESYEQYRSALDRLSTRDRELVVARMEAQWSLAEIAEHFGIPTADAARMAVNRALQRLVKEINAPDQPVK